MQNIALKYRPDIDGLRALAVIAVLIFHAFPKFLQGGFIGVDLFFVISGFLISGLIFTHLQNESFSLLDFFKRRIRRIFPALLMMLLFCTVLGWFALFPEEYKQLGKHIASSASFISNIVFWREIGYFDNDVNAKPLLHLWSLGIEEQFYIFWPMLLMIGWKKKYNFFAIIVFCFLISFLLNVFLVSKKPVATFYLPLTRFWELLLGSLLAWILLYKQQFLTKHFKLNNLSSVVGLLLICYGLITLTKESVFPGFLATIPVIGAFLIICGGPNAWLNRKILSNPIMIWFGLISFPLYLWHWPLLSFAYIMEGEVPSTILRLMIIFISIVLAWLTYNFIEKPIRLGTKYNKYKTKILLFMMILMLGIGLYVKKHQGIKGRFNNVYKIEGLNKVSINSQVEFVDCRKVLPIFKSIDFDGKCLISKEDHLPDMFLIGDSHAGHYRVALGEENKNKSVLAVEQTSCLPFSGDFFYKGECKQKSEAILSFLEKNTSIKTVYLSGYWAYLMTGGFSKTGLNWRNANPVDENGKESFLRNGKEFLTRLLKTNKEVIFFKDIPDLDFNINTCFATRPLNLSFSHHTIRENCWLKFEEYQQRTLQYDEVINELLKGFPQIKIYDPRPLFCKEGRCIGKDKQLAYYQNGDHLNEYGADMVIKDMKQHAFS